MDQLITNGLVTFGAAFAASSFSKAEGPGRALDDLMTLVGFERLHEVAELKRAKREHNLQMYKESIAQKMVAIPEKNIQEPPMAIVGPALEASKYYIEEDQLREMFAKVIASSMDNSKNNIVHPSFVEIIKQLTPLDASNLKVINTSPSGLPIAQYTTKQHNGNGSSIIKEIIFLENKSQQNIDIQAASISNLSRLGVIEYSFMRWLTDESRYNHLLNNHITDFYKERVNKLEGAERKFDAQKGMLNLTPYGLSFCSICL